MNIVHNYPDWKLYIVGPCAKKCIINDINNVIDNSKNTNLLKTNIVIIDKKIIIEHFYANSFPDTYRHSRILNRWREILVETNTDYCFHLEDDYLFVDFFDIEDGIRVLNFNDDCAYVSYFQSYKKFPKEYKPKTFYINNICFWEWIYNPELPLNVNLFNDESAAIQSLNGDDFWMMYINWPHFSLRPGIHNVEKLLSIGEFSTNYDINNMRTELEFAIRWSKKWKTYCHEKFMVINLAWDESQSSYTLNNCN